MSGFPEIGSVWVEDYDYGTGYVRRVKVAATANGKVCIKNLETGRTTWAKADRFGKKGGYLPADGASS